MVVLVYLMCFSDFFVGIRRLVPYFGAVSGSFRSRFGARPPCGTLLLHYEA
jgi:hypothetical protein